MLFNLKNSFLFIILAGFVLYSCTAGRHNKKTVEAAMKRYDRLIEKMDFNSIAMMYTPDGDLGNIAHGRDSIAKFLSGFKNVKVLSQTSNTEFIKATHDSALQKGTYRQRVVITVKDTVTIRGKYIAKWIRLPQEGWRIKRMDTQPLK